jgi:spore coat polysaccharide biosynthesis protein SpsF
MKIAIIVQARMGSTRYPGKVLRTVNEKPLLMYLIERLRRVELAHEIIVATTQEPQDDIIERFCVDNQIICFRGSTNDVLARFLGAIEKYAIDVVIRVTGDCPLIDPALIDDIIRAYLANIGLVDYVSNCTVTRTFPRGMDAELVTAAVLKKINDLITLSIDREHVTNFINRYPERFKRLGLSQSVDQSSLRLTVDTEEDFLLIRAIFEKLYPESQEFGLHDILTLLNSEPELILINKDIAQKSDHVG